MLTADALARHVATMLDERVSALAGTASHDRTEDRANDRQPSQLLVASATSIDSQSRRSGVLAPIRARAVPPKGVWVRANRMLQIVQMGARPSGVPVSEEGQRPRGLRLVGVASFGVGLNDGDVLTEVGGIPATSLGAVIAAVGGAVNAHAKAISAVIWRGETKFPLLVEIPWPDDVVSESSKNDQGKKANSKVQ